MPDLPAPFVTPEWARHAVFYQIFPDRFANGDPANDPENTQPWGTPPSTHNFMGGDLQGIVDRLDYLAELGIGALYLNPIFQATSNHKYNTFDYLRIDPHFGDLATFHRLIAAAHGRGIRVVLDGVFNHCGRGFYAFHDVMENGGNSPYLRWFQIDRFPINPYDGERPANYRTWWDFRSLPKFNTGHPPVRRYLLDVARYWIEQGADGWRLDVPNEIADHDFWREFRAVVKAANPEAYIVGEIWNDATPWLDGTQFDAVMNYLFRDLCRDFFARDTLRADAFGAGVDHLHCIAHGAVQIGGQAGADDRCSRFQGQPPQGVRRAGHQFDGFAVERAARIAVDAHHVGLGRAHAHAVAHLTAIAAAATERGPESRIAAQFVKDVGLEGAGHLCPGAGPACRQHQDHQRHQPRRGRRHRTGRPGPPA